MVVLGIVKMNRVWAMHNKDTFSIKPINALIVRYFSELKTWIDPFFGNNPFKSACNLTNDLNPETNAEYHLNALDFLKHIENNIADGVFFDPPYSPRQVSECYKNVGKTVTMFDTQSSFWSECKREIARITKIKGIVISCGWNSNGIGKTLGFKLKEILLVAHGNNHNDTIVTVEEKNTIYDK
jgi:hypothetical protein